MAACSDYLEKKILDYVLRDQADWAPTAVYLSLHSSDPTDDDGGEITAGSNTYVRQAITFAAAHATTGVIASNSVETFSDMPGVTVTHMGLHDAETDGNLLFHSALAASKTVAAGDTVQFASGAITVTLA
tara:strand:- start:2184 stop:2573 length:390 start_codon:yes stop_codon:yes gene_type:complete